MQNVLPPSLRAVVYSRVSTEAQVEGTSLDHQEKESLRWCREHAAQVVDVIRDEGVSGAAFLSRPGIQRALSLIKSGQANVLVVYKVDRAARDTEVLHTIVKQVRRAGGTIAFSDGTVFLDNPTGNAMLGMSGVMATFEKEEMVRRMKQGRVDLLVLGVQACRSRFPLGYRIIQKKDIIRGERSAQELGTYEIIEEQAELVRWMFEQYAAGASLYRIATSLSDRGVPAPRSSGRWNTGTIRNILSNPVYKGKPIVRKWQRLTDDARKGTKQGTRTIRNDHYFVRRRDPAELIELSAPAIVTEEVWDRCREIRERGEMRSGGRPDAKSLLTTLLRCPACGRGMTAYKKYYRCHHVARTATHPCTLTRCFSRPGYDAAVLEALRSIATQKAMQGAAQRAHRRSKLEGQMTFSDTWEKIQDDAAELDKRERAIVEAQVVGIQHGADPAVYSSLFLEIAEKRKVLEERRRVLSRLKQPANPAALVAASECIKRACAALITVLTDPRVPMLEKRHALVNVIERIDMVEGGAVIHFVGLGIPVGVEVP